MQRARPPHQALETNTIYAGSHRQQASPPAIQPNDLIEKHDPDRRKSINVLTSGSDTAPGMRHGVNDQAEALPNLRPLSPIAAGTEARYKNSLETPDTATNQVKKFKALGEEIILSEQPSKPGYDARDLKFNKRLASWYVDRGDFDQAERLFKFVGSGCPESNS